MKRFLLICSALSMLVFSCKKDKTASPAPSDNKTYPITFNVSGFGQTYAPMGLKGNAGKKVNATDTIPVESLTFSLYTDSLDTLIAQKTLKKSDSGFGVFKENVPPGNYSVIFMGRSPVAYDQTGVSYPYDNREVFYKRINVTVASAPVSQSVELERVSGQLVLNINDAIPANTQKITIDFRTLAGIFQAGEYLNKTETILLTAADAGKTNYRRTINLLADSVPFTVTVKYYKANLTTPTGTAVINDVVCKPNVRTILSGNLFTNDPPDGGAENFTITIDPSWNTPVTTEF
ncbi:hypothetical protein LJ707_15130 [Mucilaginibacter sp. UR6-1]|uniref:hypothetical protein n=1 Tax=Mucilaginibacter sp. UR6-1 TaxID=1435643 RepID=UPI001E448631|nr:hypothetical protein [Mucilaginibacter sp. UR6-1]MCC8410273.1 hypothetical protein [Mucilaginibacter sp. UR6-1]